VSTVMNLRFHKMLESSRVAGRLVVSQEGLSYMELARIREVLDSNSDPETGYPEVFRDFPESLEANIGIVPRIRPRSIASAYVFHGAFTSLRTGTSLLYHSNKPALRY
jgi:hypothetical protein